MSEFLTPAQVAERLQVCTRTVYRAVKAGTLPHVEGIGQVIRIPSRAIDKLAEPNEDKRRTD